MRFSKIKAVVVISLLLFFVGGILHETESKVMDDEPPTHADWEIEHGLYYFDETFTIDGNITIKEGGSLMLSQAIVKMVSSYPGEHMIRVENGGELYLDSSLVISSPNYCWESRIQNGTLTSPAIDLDAPTATLSFWSKYMPKGSPGVVEILDHGIWTTVPFSAGNPGKWNFITIDLSSYAGKVIKLRFRASLSSIQTWCIDDISIPEIGFFESGEGEINWDAVGWVKAENPPKNPFLFIIENGGKLEIKKSIISGCGYEENPPIYDHSGLWVFTDAIKIEDSEFSNCFNGIVLYKSDSHVIKDTTFTKNENNAILLLKSLHNSFENCMIFNNQNGIKIFNSSLSLQMCEIYANENDGIFAADDSTIDFDGVKVYNNKDGTKFIRWHGDIEGIRSFGNDGDGIELVDCNGVWIKELEISQNEVGVKIVNSSDVTVERCNLSANKYGIWTNSLNNLFFHNNFIGNEFQAWDEGSNSWDNGKEGNYWDDYGGSDANGDGIGDIPYNIPGGENEDRYPLMDPVGIDTIPPSVEIIRPSNYLYVGDREIIPTAYPIIFGKITVKAEAIDYSPIKKVEFFVDGVFRYEDRNEPYEWLWDEVIMGGHVIGISATDAFGNVGESGLPVIVFNV